MAFLEGVSEALVQVVGAPFKDLSVLWQLIPIILMWLILEIYFSRWEEELGWNSALANAFTLFWVAVTMLQVIFGNEGAFTWPKLLLLIAGMFYAIFLIYLVFKHAVRDKIAFLIASPVIVYFLSGLFIIWGHGLLEFSWYVLLVLFVIFMIVLLIDFLLKKLIPKRGTSPIGAENKPFGSSDSSFNADSSFGSNFDSSEPSLNPEFDPDKPLFNPEPHSSQQSQQQSPSQPPSNPIRHRRSSPFGKK